jgi:voltage-gated potassium channel
VRSDESLARWTKRFEIPTAVAAGLVIPALVIEADAGADNGWQQVAVALNWLIWTIFAAEFITLIVLAPDRRAWLKHHRLDTAIVVLTPPFAPAALQGFRALRLLRLLRLVRTARLLRQVLSPEGIGFVGVAAALLVVVGGATFASVEPQQNLSSWDGVWWATTTVTTVGYGDISPQTDVGRIIAIVVMFAGIGFVALLTAALAQTVIGTRSTDPAVVERLDAIASRLDRLEDTLRSR